METDIIRTSLFTRQQIAQLTGIDDSSLNYWMREGLLRPVEGGAGKGSHRRFPFVQVNIAVVFGQLKRFGVGIAALRSLAKLMQSAVDLGSSVDLYIANYSTAAWLADHIARYAAGEEVLVQPNLFEEAPDELSVGERSSWSSYRRPAESEEDLITNLLKRALPDVDQPQDILAAARLFGPGRSLEARIYQDLVSDVVAPGYSSEITWLLSLDDAGHWDIEVGTDGHFFTNINDRTVAEFGSAIFVPLGPLLRQVWSLKTPDQIQREFAAEFSQELLQEAGLQVRVYPAPDDESLMTVDFAPPVTLDEIEKILRRPVLQRNQEEGTR